MGVRYALFIVAVEEKTMIDREMNTRIGQGVVERALCEWEGATVVGSNFCCGKRRRRKMPSGLRRNRGRLIPC